MAKIKIALILLCAVAIFLLTGCAGGGGSVHIPPEYIEANSPTAIKMELTVCGAGSGKLNERYTNITLYYRISGQEEFTSVSMIPTSITKKRLYVQATLPPFDVEDNTFVEYYIDFLFDGHYNKREIVRVPVKKVKQPVQTVGENGENSI